AGRAVELEGAFEVTEGIAARGGGGGRRDPVERARVGGWVHSHVRRRIDVTVHLPDRVRGFVTGQRGAFVRREPHGRVVGQHDTFELRVCRAVAEGVGEERARDGRARAVVEVDDGGGHA